MYKKKECVAMLLAGGQGSRLYALTSTMAKPAVQFGGKYRIIDFPLSNCINSGIDTVGVLTQYQPLELNDYIGNGLPWDLDRTFGGVKILPPYQGQGKGDWYRGTANAIYQNMHFIDLYDPEYVLILSGDHIYKMDYAKMLDYHKEKNADCTIAVINVSIEEASRFGIMSADEENKIFKFEEKPKKPESTLASMGIYIFNKKKLFAYLEEDEATEGSSNDFGKNIIPAMLGRGEKMYAYPFDGYWKDVGTISSLWEANMDLLGDTPNLDVGSEDWRIYARHDARAPQYVGADAIVENSVITEGSEIYGTVKNSIIGANVVIGKGACVCDSVIMSGTVVEENAFVGNSIVADDVKVEAGATVGGKETSPELITLIGAKNIIASGTTVAPGETKYSPTV
ncbi:MAG: glucose-1-phosphate adenylyltransferase [Clostridia bacterium]|nr:glucose-1-phosphate adenylyltransferase [Clostridia bacterium]